MVVPGSDAKTRWSGFPISKVLQNALERNGYVEPTPIQTRALEASLIKNRHVLGAAQTGSGKTLAYAIPVIDDIIKSMNHPCSLLKRKICNVMKREEDFEFIGHPFSSTSDEGDFSCPEAVILVPTRELAVQVNDEFMKICRGTHLKSCYLIGGLSQDKQLRVLEKQKPQIVIATPGRLYDIVQSDIVSFLNRQSLACIRAFVIDEADRMIQKGHFQELLSIIQIVNIFKEYRKEKHRLKVYLFSATLTFLHELPDRLRKVSIKDNSTKDLRSGKASFNKEELSKTNKISRMINLLQLERSETKVIDLSKNSRFGRPPSDKLTELKVNCSADEKDLYLYYFLVSNRGRRTLVFCNSKDCLRRLANVLKYLKVETTKLSADMDQKKRISSLERFRKNPNLVLLATDVAARGLDVPNLECVVHYQVPKTCESFIHRSGRTARYDKTGISLTLCEPKETSSYRRLCNNINGGRDLLNYEFDTRIRSSLQSKVKLAQQCDKLDHHLREKKSTSSWFEKTARECEIDLDEDELRRLSGRGISQEENLEEDVKNKRRLSLIKKRLDILLKTPLG